MITVFLGLLKRKVDFLLTPFYLHLCQMAWGKIRSTYLFVMFNADGESGHVHWELPSSDPAVVEPDDLAVLDNGGGNSKLSHKTNRKSRYSMGFSELKEFKRVLVYTGGKSTMSMLVSICI